MRLTQSTLLIDHLPHFCHYFCIHVFYVLSAAREFGQPFSSYLNVGFLFILSKNFCYTVKLVFLINWLIDGWIFCVFYRVKEWVDQMQKDLIKLTDKASGLKRLTEVSVASRTRTHIYTLRLTSEESNLKASFSFLFFCNAYKSLCCTPITTLSGQLPSCIVLTCRKKTILTLQLEHRFNSYKRIRSPWLCTSSAVFFLIVPLNLNRPEGLCVWHTDKYIHTHKHTCGVRHRFIVLILDGDHPSRLLNNWLFGICVSCYCFLLAVQLNGPVT